MTPEQQKIAQYLSEALMTEHTLVRELQTQIAMTPRGSYRSRLERHLDETREHADRVSTRLDALGARGNPFSAATQMAEAVLAQAAAMSRLPLVLLRGGSAEEKLLKNAKDAAASEALEIATYRALERLAQTTGDQVTADLAAAILRDEQRMLDGILEEIPRLTDAVSGAELEGEPSYRAETTGAADAARKAARPVARAARKQRARRRSGEPWPGYDAQTVAEIRSRLSSADAQLARRTRTYERSHKNRAGVITAAKRELAGAS